jgi:hypothetical protein
MVCNPPGHQQHQQAEQPQSHQDGDDGLQQQLVQNRCGLEADQGQDPNHEWDFAEDSRPHHPSAPSQCKIASVVVST